MLPAYAAREFGRSRPTTAAAAPAAFCWVHLQVVGREQMAIAADFGYGHGLEDAFRGKAHHTSFGCFKAGPATIFKSTTYKKYFSMPAAAARGISGQSVR